MPFSYVQFMTELMAPQPSQPRLTPLRKDISQATIGICHQRSVRCSKSRPGFSLSFLTRMPSVRRTDC